MAKYINVEVSLKKIIKVDSDTLDDALKQAKKDFSYLEHTPDWLDARLISFEENPIIRKSAEYLSNSYSSLESFSTNDLEDYLNIAFTDNEIKKYVYDETIKLLKENYGIKPDVKI